MSQPRVPVAAVYGGGGIYGIGYGLGVVDGLRAGGIDLVDAPALGTSAGSWVAASTALGVGIDSLRALEPPRVPELRPGVLAGKARELYGDASDPRVRAVTTQLPTGAKFLLDGAEHRLADLCAASSAVPGIFAPHTVGGRLHVDGGVRSMASVDAAPAADLLVIVVPIGGRVLGPAGRVGELQLRREIRSWQRRNVGADVLVVKPNRAIAALAGPNPMALFDKGRALAAYELAVEQGRARAALVGRPRPGTATGRRAA